jgi:hypothetical protein
MFKLFVNKIYNTCLSYLLVRILSKNLTRKRKISKEDFAKELNKGIEIELKQFDNKAVAKSAAIDNLYENPNYYNEY